MRLDARDLCIDRSSRPIVSALSFTVEAGQMLVVTGPNGAGKSTLLRALAGLLPLASGSITWTGWPAEPIIWATATR